MAPSKQLVEGIQRAEVHDLQVDNGYFNATAHPLPADPDANHEVEAVRAVR